MSRQNTKKSSKKAWYYSLAVCVVACGVAAFSIFGTSPESDVTSDITTTTSIAEGKEVAASVKDAADKRDSAKVTQSETPVAAQTSDLSEREQLNENVPFESNYILPVSTEILKDYSDGEFVYNESSGDWRLHNGVDFTGDESTEVKAVISGEITSVINDSRLGTIVEVNHGNKLLARYCGLKNVNVSKGDFVTQGDIIGKIGAIPVESGKPHIHFEMLLDGAYVDPLAVMGKAE